MTRCLTNISDELLSGRTISRKLPIFLHYISIGMYPEILSEQQHLLLPYVKSLKKEDYLVGGYEVSQQQVKDFLIEVSTGRL